MHDIRSSGAHNHGYSRRGTEARSSRLDAGQFPRRCSLDARHAAACVGESRLSFSSSARWWQDSRPTRNAAATYTWIGGASASKRLRPPKFIRSSVAVFVSTTETKTLGFLGPQAAQKPELVIAMKSPLILVLGVCPCVATRDKK
jgi:hypothetical protein